MSIFITRSYIPIKIYLAIRIRTTAKTSKPRNPLTRLLSAWSMLLKRSEERRVGKEC